MISIVSSTNRNNSNTLKVAQYYQNILNELGKSNQIIDLRDIPENYLTIGMYGTSGQNEDFNKLREKVALTDKFIFIIPEYNGSFPGILKLFIDGLPYPNCVKGKTAALCGLSGGPIGGLLALSHFTDILNYLNCNVLAIKPRIANISKEFENQEFKSDFIKNIIHEQITQLINI
jgi:NAD(P)H-dependent FMN reductase